MMSGELFVPLELLELGGGMIRGKVRMQKLAFLIQQKSKAIDYEFEPAPLGPLSYPLSDVMRHLQDLGLMAEKTEHTASGNEVFCYYLTDRGRSLLKVVRDDGGLSAALRRAVQQIHEKYGEMSYLDLLDHVHRRYPVYHLKGISLEDFGGACYRQSAK